MASVQLRIDHHNKNQILSNIPSTAEASDFQNILVNRPKDIHHRGDKATDNNNNHNSMNHKNDSIVQNVSPMKQLKKMGWYWGSISPDYATRLLENEQDGSFLVRDSSSECYIFSMTFKLNGQIHHSRIEHCKGQFSFGRSPKFICTTIVDFIEQAIECSHNGNLRFFLHRDPSTEGPVPFRMIPLSRLQGLSSLKHMCRFAILPYVRRDKISELSIPRCLREYLYEPFQPIC